MRILLMTLTTLGILLPAHLPGEDPPALNPFGTQTKTREDALPGYAELSDGQIFAGKLYLTRDARLKIYDEQVQRHREIPLRVIESFECKVKREWMEKEWRFKENANNEKFFTGREYPAREYLHTVKLKDGRQVTGPLSGVVYVESYEGGKARKLLLHKRQKGQPDTKLATLVYLKKVELGEKAMRDALVRKQSPKASRR